MSNWPISGRDVHFLGGIHAINLPSSNQVKVYPSTIDGKSAVITIPTYQKLYEGLAQVGLSELVGTEFYTDVSHTDGSAPSEWRTHTAYKSKPWSHTEAIWHWSHVSNQGHKLKEAFLWDIAKRISHQISTLNESFKVLSHRYRKQLMGRCIREKIEIGSKFEDGFSKEIYSSFQHFLFDACTLRDYLSEFIFHFILTDEEKLGVQHMNITSRIFKKYFKDKSQPTVFRANFKNACDKNGWLNILGSYRDLVTHACPMSMAGGHLWIRVESITLNEGKLLPKIVAPIPLNPEAIKLERNTLESFDKFDQKLKEFFGQSNDEKQSHDILTYSKTVMANFSSFIWELAEESPYKGIKHTITDNDVIGKIKIVNR